MSPASADVLDAHEAGWFLGAHIETVRRLARIGKLPAYKMGKDWRFSKTDGLPLTAYYVRSLLSCS